MELPADFNIGEAKTWPYWLFPLFCGAIFIGLEILSIILPTLFRSWGHIEVRGKHLDELSSTDKFYILINKFATTLFVYHFLRYTSDAKNIKWRLEEATFANTVVAMIAFYAFYDFFYMWFHWLLHNRSLYRFIHKHHHRYFCILPTSPNY